MGEFEDVTRRRGVLDELRALSKPAKLAIGGVAVALILLVAALTSPARTPTTPAAASSPLPMTPSTPYIVGQDYYADTIPMPDYRGWTLQAAVNDLGTKGISVTADPASASSVVVSQNPYPGTLIKQSTASSIQLMVSAAPTTTTTVPPTTTAAPPPVVDDSSSSSGGSVDLPHVPHPHAHVCVGGKHIHVCS